MTLPTEAITTAALSAALDRASARHAAIAGNIANANSAGYVPARLDFAGQLAEVRAVLEERGRIGTREIEALRSAARMEPEPDGDVDARVRIDVEMTELARNAVQFQALSQALTRHLGVMALAAADGRK